MGNYFLLFIIQMPSYFDQQNIKHKKACEIKFNELKKHIVSIDENGKLNEWALAMGHIQELENKLEEQAKQIEEYKAFFNLMNKLLPKNTDKFLKE